MTNIELTNRVEFFRANFEAEGGKPFKDFYCPILMRDEPAELCKGHVINDVLGTCGQWVPQRSDVDSFYGYAVEADLVQVVRDRGRNLMEIWADPAGRRHRPKVIHGETEIGHYFPKRDAKVVPPGHTLAQLVNEQGDSICNFALKISSDELAALDASKMRLEMNHDFRAPVIASMIKAAHLSMFRIFGYRHVFSPTGYYPAVILRQFFERHGPPNRCTSQDVEAFFRPLARMVVPLMNVDRSILQGTVKDRRFFSCFAASGGIFAVGVVIDAGADDMFCVFLPGMERHFETYVGFLKDPPSSIGVRLTQYCTADEKGGGRMEIPPGDPVRIPLPRGEFVEEEAGAIGGA